MSFDYKRKVPQYILTIIVAVFLIEYALPEGPLTFVKNELTLWLTIIASFTFFVAAITLIVRYSRELTGAKQGSGMMYAIEFFAVFVIYIGVALLTGGVSGDSYKWLMNTIYGNGGSSKGALGRLQFRLGHRAAMQSLRVMVEEA